MGGIRPEEEYGDISILEGQIKVMPKDNVKYKTHPTQPEIKLPEKIYIEDENGDFVPWDGINTLVAEFDDGDETTI